MVPARRRAALRGGIPASNFKPKGASSPLPKSGPQAKAKTKGAATLMSKRSARATYKPGSQDQRGRSPLQAAAVTAATQRAAKATRGRRVTSKAPKK